ncbi:hypothetical protein V6N12_005754 [Hibiscus sabdariffa]|uniref:Uncharacterized protein n=1 Tax=Hibiscus sabdariffa TaxID=183260 RepID=A0ABR2ALU3_9ROSI
MKMKMDVSFYVEPVAIAGGLVLWWTNNVSVDVLNAGKNFIDAKFWNYLSSLRTTNSEKWCIIGDSNIVAKPEEKQGGLPFDASQAKWYYDFMDLSCMVELPIKGETFTWSNLRSEDEAILEKLDRILVSLEWNYSFPKAIGAMDAAIASDHAPIILFIKGINKNTRRDFKFEAKWLLEDGCINRVKESWSSSRASNTNLMFGRKLNRTRANLRQWSRARRKETRGREEGLKERIKDHFSKVYKKDEEIDFSELEVLESIARTSLLGHSPLYGGISVRDISCKQRSSNYQLRVTELTGRRIVLSPLQRLKADRVVNSEVEVRATELTKEVHAYREEERSPRKWKDEIDNAGIGQKPELWPPENRADKPSLHNPRLRQERMSCGWLAAIFDWEGVIIQDNPELEKEAWLTLAEEEGRSPIPAFMLRRIEGTKNEQAISEILCWSRDPASVKRMAARKEEIYQSLHGGVYRFCDGSSEFVDVLMHYNIPMALVSKRPRKTLEAAIRTIGIEGCFSAIVSAEDVCRGKPDPEMFVYAAQLLEFIAERCIVFGNSNQTIEAAHDAWMKCVAVANKHRVYELGAADLVVRRLDELSIVDLKNLADIESPEFGSREPKPMMEEDDEPST